MHRSSKVAKLCTLAVKQYVKKVRNRLVRQSAAISAERICRQLEKVNGVKTNFQQQIFSDSAHGDFAGTRLSPSRFLLWQCHILFLWSTSVALLLVVLHLLVDLFLSHQGCAPLRCQAALGGRGQSGGRCSDCRVWSSVAFLTLFATAASLFWFFWRRTTARASTSDPDRAGPERCSFGAALTARGSISLTG